MLDITDGIKITINMAKTWPLDAVAGAYIRFILRPPAKYLGCGVG